MRRPTGLHDTFVDVGGQLIVTYSEFRDFSVIVRFRDFEVSWENDDFVVRMLVLEGDSRKFKTFRFENGEDGWVAKVEVNIEKVVLKGLVAHIIFSRDSEH